MNYKYFFIFGKTPQLSWAEIKTILRNKQINYEVLLIDFKTVVLITDQELALETWQKQLGGTVKSGQILAQAPELEEIVWSDFYPDKAATLKRWQFGFSAYNLARSEREQLKRKGLWLKKQLIKDGLPARLVVSKENDLSAVIISKEHLLTAGADLVVIKDEMKKVFWVGKTIACQNIADYVEAEFGRPQIDGKRGMTPVKLAKMMVNLATEPKDTLLDPFCGLGTILTTAAGLGWLSLAGSDLDKGAVEQAKLNWSWFIEKNKSVARAELKVGSAAHLNQLWSKQKFSSLVTEPDLGPPLRREPTDRELKEIQTKLIFLYRDFLDQAAESLTKDSLLVMIWPIWRQQDEWVCLPVERLINWEAWQLVDNDQKKYRLQTELFGRRGSLWYARADQFVGREIWVLSKK